MQSVVINRNQYLEFEKIVLGAMSPLSGFMNEKDFISVCETMRLSNGQPFPLPVVLDLDEGNIKKVKEGQKLTLIFNGVEVGTVLVDDIYMCNKEERASQIFKTTDPLHPGVSHFYSMGKYFVGGSVELFQRVHFEFSDYELTPAETRKFFELNDWKTIVGFQTRNVPHRAHEYLLRLALEIADGLFIQPLVGRKKDGDYTPESILTAYKTLINNFLPYQRVLLGVLSTSMRYAGPREAVFHAIVRRNYGCTHFIIGRDHAGVGNFYTKYEAQELACKFQHELGIQILNFAGPFYCSICDGIVTERTCPHILSMPHVTKQISGTDMRSILSNGHSCPKELMRPEVLQSIKDIPIFINGSTEKEIE